LRRPPRRVDPAVDTIVPGLRRPDITPTGRDLRAALDGALAASRARRAEAIDDHHELTRLRSQNVDLRGALEHLEGVTKTAHDLEAALARVRDELQAAEQERSRLAAALDAARASRLFRLTGRPAALRDTPDRQRSGV
jgi:chromosome segregation ATPase